MCGQTNGGASSAAVQPAKWKSADWSPIVTRSFPSAYLHQIRATSSGPLLPPTRSASARLEATILASRSGGISGGGTQGTLCCIPRRATSPASTGLPDSSRYRYPAAGLPSLRNRRSSSQQPARWIEPPSTV